MSDRLPPQTMLAEVTGLRRRTRADRRAYWLPLLVLGLAHLAAAPFYRWTRVDGPAPGSEVPPGDLYSLPAPVVDVPSGPAYLGPDPDRIASYWLAALLLSALVTVWWYRRHGRRVGVEGRVTGAVVAAALAVAGYALVQLLPQPVPVRLREFAPLLVIAVGLLALARLERSLGLAAVAVAYTAAAVLANTYQVDTVAAGLRGAPDDRFMSLPALLLPAAVLLLGGAAAAGRAARARHRTAPARPVVA